MVRATVAKRRHALAWDASPRNKARAVSKSRSDGMCSPATQGTHAVALRLCIAASDDLGLASQASACHCFAVIKTSRSPPLITPEIDNARFLNHLGQQFIRDQLAVKSLADDLRLVEVVAAHREDVERVPDGCLVGGCASRLLPRTSGQRSREGPGLRIGG